MPDLVGCDVEWPLGCSWQWGVKRWLSQPSIGKGGISRRGAKDGSPVVREFFSHNSWLSVVRPLSVLKNVNIGGGAVEFVGGDADN